MTAHRLHFVLYVNGIFLFALAAFMLVPMAVDFGYGNPDAVTFLASAAFTSVVAAFLFITFRHPGERGFDRRTGYMITVSSWISASVFGAIPFVFSSRHIGFTDAMFETVSGLTTTGATVLHGLDYFPPGLLLWRSLLHWIGGIGIIVMALSMLPALGVGGMQLFLSESSDISGKTFPKVKQIAQAIGIVYVSLTVANVALLVVAGMPLFDAINIAMATIATGGFSIKDASIGYYNSVPIEVVTIVFMIAGAMPLAFYAKFIMQRGRVHFFDEQIGAFMKIWALMVALDHRLEHLARHGAGPCAARVGLQRHVDHHRYRLRHRRLLEMGQLRRRHLLRPLFHRRLRRLDGRRHQDLPLAAPVLGLAAPAAMRLLPPNRTIALTYQQKPVADETLGGGAQLLLHVSRHLHRAFAGGHGDRTRLPVEHVGRRRGDGQCRPRSRPRRQSVRQFPQASATSPSGSSCSP